MSKFKVFTGIMIFYILLSYLFFPLIFYYAFGRNLISAGNGFIVGSIISMLLWYFYGKKLVQ
jgi:hypothetical protein